MLPDLLIYSSTLCSTTEDADWPTLFPFNQVDVRQGGSWLLVTNGGVFNNRGWGN